MTVETVPVIPEAASSSLACWTIQAGLVVAVLGWLWPIGVGGQMPVGGDATQFSIGLMAFLRESLRSGRLPLWNDLWGFGFPGLAESQMGVYYPIHWAYAVLSTESAYTASLASHFVWGALGARWLARRLGVSALGSALSGFAWATSGFFLIHLPHQWAYTVGSWMPWAWGLAWQTVRGSGRPARSAWLLAAVLAVQVLPGHFQLAFITEVSVVALGLAGVGRGRVGRVIAVIGAVAAVLPLAACQLVPTAALAQLSGGERGFEYLSGFAATPLHLISHVAPGLFHRSPLWRPVAWDLFHTAPEEYLGYVGLVPLWLSLRAVALGFRSQVAVRALALVGLLTLILSLGPYVPGFRGLINLPGFSFFRAPARWGLATSLALAVLAGFGFDAVRQSGWSRRSLLGFGLGSTLAVGLVVGGFELALLASRGAGIPAVASGFDRVLAAFPWASEPGEKSFRAALAEAYRPQADLRVQAAQARLDGALFPPGGLILARERGGIYARELIQSAVHLLALLILGLALAQRPRALAGGLVILTVLDLVGHGRNRPFDLGPVRSLVAQSPVLTRAQASSPGLRTLDPAQNLFLVAGADSATAYRTLTLPTPGAWLGMARGLDPAGPRLLESLRALGTGARVLDPFEARSVPSDWRAGAWGKPGEVIADPTLAAWLYGADFARLNRISEFRWIKAAQAPSRAWRVDDIAMIDQATVDLLTTLAHAEPLTHRSPWPERFEVDWHAEPDLVGRTWLVITQTYDPEWAGNWVNRDDQARPARVVRTPEGFTAVAVPALPPGDWTLRLDYQGRAARQGLLISLGAWPVWLGVGITIEWWRRRQASKLKVRS